jgi:hypothetical protein
VGPEEARAEVSRILDAELDALTEHRRLSVLPARAEEAWDLPPADRRLLWSYGLPLPRDDELTGAFGDFQTGYQPELRDGNDRLYLLGWFDEARLAAREASGAVLVIPPFSAEDVHPHMREAFPDGVHPQLVNSTVGGLVQLAWRWHWLVPVLADQQTLAGQAEHAAWTGATRAEEKAALPDFYAGVRALAHEIVERFQAVDPAAITDVGSFWYDVVMEYL